MWSRQFLHTDYKTLLKKHLISSYRILKNVVNNSRLGLGIDHTVSEYTN